MILPFNTISRIIITILWAGLSCIDLIAQDGVIIINELNPESGCNQYIELTNLGPGRQNIGCYKIVNEKYAITIPPDTYLEPGKIFLIAGVGSITCGIASNMPVNLNWTTCANCTSVTLTTNQFFADWPGGNKSFPLALLNSNNQIIDAIRSSGGTLETLQPPTTNTANSSGTGCSTATINLPTDINPTTTIYESITQNLGNNSTFSRSGDGSCTWYKAESNTRTPGLSNAISGGTPSIAVTSNYNLSCATNSYTSTLTLNINYGSNASYWVSSAYALNSSFNPTISSTPTQQSTATTSILNNPSAGFYSYLFSPTQNATCGQVPFIVQVIDPIMAVTPTYNFDCVGGIANFQVTNVGANNTNAPYYFPMSYSLYTMNSGVIASTYTSSIKTSPNFVQVSSLPAGDYRMALTPASAYACPKSIDFTVSTLPAASLTTSITTVPACDDGSQNGRAEITITNSQPQDYYPITYVLRNTANSSIVATNSISQDLFYINNLTAGNYSLELDPALGGCLTSNFSISITSVGCDVLSQKLKSFTGKNIGSENEFNIEIDTDEILEKIHLESSENGTVFEHVGNIPFQSKKGMQTIIYRTPATQFNFYRLQLHDILNRIHNSSVIRITNQSGDIGIKTFPNPIGDYLTLSNFATKDDVLMVQIISTSGRMLYEQRFAIKSGSNNIKVPTSRLPKGQFILSLQKISTGDRQSSTLIKYE